MQDFSQFNLGSFLLNTAVLTGWLLVGAVILRFILIGVKGFLNNDD